MAHVMADQIPYFIPGREGASADGALVAGRYHQGPQRSSADDKLHETSAAFADAEVIIPLDFKLMAPSCCGVTDGRTLYCRFGFTSQPEQSQKVAFFVLGSIECWDRVLLVPRCYLALDESAVGPQFHASPDVYITDRHATLEPFPVEFAPFEVPLSMLRAAADSILRFESGESAEW
jgi:hypothetical protein